MGPAAILESPSIIELRSAYTLSSPDSTSGITLDMQLLLLLGIDSFLIDFHEQNFHVSFNNLKIWVLDAAKEYFFPNL